MIGDLMDATRVETGKLSLEIDVLHLASALTTAVQSVAPEVQRRGLTLHCEFEPDLPEVVADAGRVAQIAANLLSNAIKFTATPGSIRVSAARCPEDPQQVRIAVADTGHGIEPDSLPLVFERFWQDRGVSPASRKGLGLGLYLCRELVTQLGGRIWAESTPGQGSCFRFTLPVYETGRMLQRVDPDGPLTLLTIALERTDPSARPDPAFEDLVKELHAALSRLVWHECDVVLPRRRGSTREVLAVVAQTDATGAQALRRRFERSITNLRSMLDSDARVILEAWPLDAPADRGRSCAELGRAVDRRLLQLRFPAPALPGDRA
jgi:two-component sensor histidine kinase